MLIAICQLSTNTLAFKYHNSMNVKTEVLHYLMDNIGSFISGTALSESFNCSRMAISKAVASLQSEGFPIDVSKRLGYKLNAGADVLSTASLLKELEDSNIDVYCYNEIDSTNKKAKELSLNGIKPPFVVVANRQTGGRGRLGRAFSSPEGGLYFSLVLSGKDIINPDLLTTSASLAVSRALERLSGIKTDIKWVNDLYLNGKKVVGILSEGLVNIEEGGLSEVVIGIGVNLNVNPEQYPEEVRAIATSFYPDGSAPFSRSKAIAECVNEVIKIQNEDFLDEYREKCFILGQSLYVLRNGNKREALALSIDDFGHLVVKYEDNTIEALSSGEVSLKL